MNPLAWIVRLVTPAETREEKVERIAQAALEELFLREEIAKRLGEKISAMRQTEDPLMPDAPEGGAN